VAIRIASWAASVASLCQKLQFKESNNSYSLGPEKPASRRIRTCAFGNAFFRRGNIRFRMPRVELVVYGTQPAEADHGNGMRGMHSSLHHAFRANDSASWPSRSLFRPHWVDHAGHYRSSSDGSKYLCSSMVTRTGISRSVGEESPIDLLVNDRFWPTGACFAGSAADVATLSLAICGRWEQGRLQWSCANRFANRCADRRARRHQDDKCPPYGLTRVSLRDTLLW